MSHKKTCLRTVKRVGAALFIIGVVCVFWTRGTASAAEGESARWTRTPRPHFVDVVEETCLSVVSIQGEKQYEVGKSSFGRDAQYDVFNGMGTGVIIDERGYILTNYHVVKGLLKLEVITADGERYRDVELLRNDVETDLAIIKIKPKKPLKRIRMGRSERVRLAEDVYAIGNPFGYSCSISHGIVSSLNRPLEVNETLSYDRVIQTDAAINPGNSGGPLINIDGEMIGLNAAVREEAENIAFAIPIDVAADVAEKMIRQSVAKMTHHGLKFRVVDSDMPDYPKDGDGEDVLVVDSVEPRSPAAEAGIQPGDALISSNGYPTRSKLEFTCSLIGLGLSDVASFEFERDGRPVEATIAFSYLANRESSSIASDERRRSSDAEPYKKSSVSSSFSDRVLTTDDEEDAESANSEGVQTVASVTKTTEKSAKSGEAIWDVFGLEVETADADEFNKRYPEQAVGIGAFTFKPKGGVVVKKVDPEGALSSGDVKIQKDDFIFGFGVGEEKEWQLSVSSSGNLDYIAKRVDEFARVDSGKARIYLIRDGKPYYLEIKL